MIYRFVHYFADANLTDEQKIEIAVRKATEDLAIELMKRAEADVTLEGNVRGYVKIGGEGE